MKILLINKFLYLKGGDATSALSTGELLRRKGHEVIFWGMDSPLNKEYSYRDYFISNVDYNARNGIGKQIRMSFNLLYSFEAKQKIAKLLKDIGKPDIVHLHNFSHQISPSVLHIFKKYNIPVVMTMHDYKLVCASYAMLAKEKICEACKDGRYYQCFLKSCVKSSYAKSLLNTIEMYLHHKILHIYDLIDIFISPSRFLKNKVREMGFKGKVFYLPYFINFEAYHPRYDWKENSIVYFGRLSREKGLFTLIEAMRRLPDITLKIIGEGPLKESIGQRARDLGLKNIIMLGYMSGEKLKEEICKSMFVVLPSEWYENYPFAIIEGFALGKPAVGSRTGGIPELVIDNETGITFKLGDPDDLSAKINELVGRPDKIMEMGKAARLFVEKELNQEKHYTSLIEIYKTALNTR